MTAIQRSQARAGAGAGRIIGIELRRSTALGVAAALVVLGVAFMYGIPGSEGWTGRWTQLAAVQRASLNFLWPLALALGAWQAGRDRRSDVGELFAGTPRPPWHRTAATAAALALAVTAASLLTTAAALPPVLSGPAYFDPSALAVLGVGPLSLIAAVWLGMAAGRFVPSRLTPPGVAVAGLLVMVFCAPAAVRSDALAPLTLLAVPALQQASDFAGVPGSVSAAQAIWMVALATSALLLLGARERRTRVLATVPALLGLIAGAALVPSGFVMAPYVTDARATRFVCADGMPRVCVRRAHAALLPEVAGPARDALRALGRLPGTPTEVREGIDYAGSPYNHDRPDPAVATFYTSVAYFDAGGLPAEIVAAGLAAGCPSGVSEYDEPPDAAAKTVAAFWLLGRQPPADGADARLVGETWQALMALPEREQRRRVEALHAAAQRCSPGLLKVLAGTER
ncbi:hypothetical protein COUCH_11105 [Couchioplanes caeruleus]|uniref:hypothetical protein n=1 Tax=Couchioplanes caeruleus TaxID=56438 RepID=UPI0020BD491E|nr:hypothetical protein [Couchioplanes caeruleus]UQU66772.1 hypothetical protein COUCH_11105 [Couchioplanes caeruleus]